MSSPIASPGQVLGGRYRLGPEIGSGAMGVVHEAVQESLGRNVAIKVLRPILAGDQDMVARFRAEAERAARLNHPHVVQVIDFGHEPTGLLWIAMERLVGTSLRDRMQAGRPSVDDALGIIDDVLKALEAAHAAKLIHRDLKPGNIFLAEVPGLGTVAKVLDFGIAKLLDGDAASKLTGTGVVLGTPLYMAPEQLRGGPIDARADLYSVGV
ncbi:MAG: serine/threonine-protein kinase, partial [Myxococcota bacterium]